MDGSCLSPLPRWGMVKDASPGCQPALWHVPSGWGAAESPAKGPLVLPPRSCNLLRSWGKLWKERTGLSVGVTDSVF